MSIFNVVQVNIKVKVKLSVRFFNWAPRHAGVLGEWRYSSTHSLASILYMGHCNWITVRFVHCL